MKEFVNYHLGQGPTPFGIEFAAFVSVQVLVQMPVGSASDRYGRRPSILLGLVVLAPVTLAQGFVTTPQTMIATRAIQGCAAAMVFAPALALAGDLANEGASGTQLSVLTMSFGLGTAIGPLASGISSGTATPRPSSSALRWRAWASCSCTHRSKRRSIPSVPAATGHAERSKTDCRPLRDDPRPSVRTRSDTNRRSLP